MNDVHSGLKNKETLFSVLLIIILVSLTVIMFIDLIPLLKNVAAHVNNEGELIPYIRNYGAKGVPIIIALQTLQVITTVFPAATVQILAGLTYGIFGGLVLCLAGYMLGNTIVFVVVRQIDRKFVPIIFKPKDTNKKKPKWDFSFLKDSNNAAFMAFLLYLIPGIPNIVLPYIFARSKISLPRYLLSVCLACIPTILLCSTVGERISKGDAKSALLIIGLLILIAVIVVIFRKKILAAFRKINH
jgi:uncharacterized membrane protein YdjX (TVP38/TMEM64 family)